MYRKTKATILAFLLLAPMLVGCGAEEEEYFSYHSTMLPVEKSLETSSFSQEDFATDDEGFVRYLGDDYEAAAVIDVSSHQGDILWERVAADGIEGVMIRAAYRGYGKAGNLKTDDCFQHNIEGALAAGLQVGVYVYSQAVNEEEAREEAELLLSMTEGYTLTLPMAFDWEYIDYADARTDSVDGAEATKIAKAFVDTVRDAGYTPILYLNPEMAYFSYDLGAFEDCDFWLADYGDYPHFAYQCRLWQYNCVLTVDGIHGAVDTNIYFREK